MNFIESTVKRVLAEIEDEIESLRNYESENPYVVRVVSDHITRLCVRHQEIQLGNMMYL